MNYGDLILADRDNRRVHFNRIRTYIVQYFIQRGRMEDSFK